MDTEAKAGAHQQTHPHGTRVGIGISGVSPALFKFLVLRNFKLSPEALHRQRAAELQRLETWMVKGKYGDTFIPKFTPLSECTVLFLVFNPDTHNTVLACFIKY